MKDESPSFSAPPPTSPLLVALAWVVVGAPLVWGILQTLKKTAPLFQ
jgi:hypothetical protein